MRRIRLGLAPVVLAVAGACFDQGDPIASGSGTSGTADSTVGEGATSATVASADGPTAEATSSSTTPDTSAGSTTESSGCGDGVANPGELCFDPMPTWGMPTGFVDPLDVRFARFDRDETLDGLALGRGADEAQVSAWTWDGVSEPVTYQSTFPLPGPMGMTVGQGAPDPQQEVGIAGATHFLALRWSESLGLEVDCNHMVTTEAFAVAPISMAMLDRDLLLAGTAAALTALWRTDLATCQPSAVHAYDDSLFSIATGRFDGDTDTDLVMSFDTGLLFLLNDGNGLLAVATQQAVVHPPARMWVAPFVGDEPGDDIVGLTDAGLVVFDVSRSGVLESPPVGLGGPVDLAIGDFDGDELPDVALADPFVDLLVIRLKEPDFAGQPIEIPLMAPLVAVDAADPDADGDVDLVALDQNGIILFFRNEM